MKPCIRFLFLVLTLSTSYVPDSKPFLPLLAIAGSPESIAAGAAVVCGAARLAFGLGFLRLFTRRHMQQENPWTTYSDVAMEDGGNLLFMNDPSDNPPQQVPPNNVPPGSPPEDNKNKSSNQNGLWLRFITAEEVARRYGKAFQRLGLKSFSRKNLKHIIKNHVPGGQGAVIGDKSIFNVGENFIELALEAWEKGKIVGNGIKEFECGRIIGMTIDGIPTSKVTIFLNGTYDSIRTIYPI